MIAAKVFGFFFHYRAPATVAVREPAPAAAAGPSAAGAFLEAEYTILAVLEFNSTRKRQSVIIRQPDGSILLQCKVCATSSLKRPLCSAPHTVLLSDVAAPDSLLVFSPCDPEPECKTLGKHITDLNKS